MRLFELLYKKRKKRKAFFSSNEYAYFLANRYKLKLFPSFPYLGKNTNDEFDIMRTNIILQGLDNKETIEIEVENINKHFEDGKPTHEKYILTLKERTINSPYFMDNNIKVFIPFFSKALNAVYYREPEKLLREPFLELRNTWTGSLIDPFTRLIKVGQKDNEAAFFHYDTNTIYFINEQGRLDVSIPLFDKYIRYPNYAHMLERIKPVVDRYIANDRDGFIMSLYEQNSISKKMLSLIRRKCKK